MHVHTCINIMYIHVCGTFLWLAIIIIHMNTHTLISYHVKLTRFVLACPVKSYMFLCNVTYYGTGCVCRVQ